MNQLVDISVSVPEEVLLSLRAENDEFAAQMKVLTALKLFETHKLSLGQSASLADMDEIEFIRLLGHNHISIFGSGAEIAEDLKHA